MDSNHNSAKIPTNSRKQHRNVNDYVAVQQGLFMDKRQKVMSKKNNTFILNEHGSASS